MPFPRDVRTCSLRAMRADPLDIITMSQAKSRRSSPIARNATGLRAQDGKSRERLSLGSWLVPWRPPVAALLVVVLVAGCGSHQSTSRAAEQAFVNSVYSQAPDIEGYRTGPQLLSLGQAICAAPKSGATIKQAAAHD